MHDLDRIIFQYIGNNESIVIHRKYSKPEILSYSYKKYDTIYKSKYYVNPILYCEYNWFRDSNILTISNELWSYVNPKQFFIKN